MFLVFLVHELDPWNLPRKYRQGSLDVDDVASVEFGSLTRTRIWGSDGRKFLGSFVASHYGDLGGGEREVGGVAEKTAKGIGSGVFDGHTQPLLVCDLEGEEEERKERWREER